MKIEDITQTNIPFLQPLQRTTEANSQLFETMIGAVSNMSHQQTTAKMQMADVLMGRSENTHGALIEMQKAELQMNLFTVVRDKTAQATNQILNMQI